VASSFFPARDGVALPEAAHLGRARKRHSSVQLTPYPPGSPWRKRGNLSPVENIEVKVVYRFSIAWNRSRVVQLERLGLTVEQRVPEAEGGGLAICVVEEGHPSWAETSQLMKSWKAFTYIDTEFSSEEILGAEYCHLVGEHNSSYPQPEDEFRDVTYDTSDYCSNCGIGSTQRAPFRVRNQLKWGRNDFLRLFLVPDEFFMKAERWKDLLAPQGVAAREVADVRGKALDSVVQLDINERVALDLGDIEGEVCPACGRQRYLPHSRGFFPAPLNPPEVPMFRSQQYFGVGHSGFNCILVDASMAEFIVAKGLKGVRLWPCAPASVGSAA